MTASSNPIRVGLVGYGFVGKTFHAPMIRATPGLQLAAVASSDAAKVTNDLGEVQVVADPIQLVTDPGLDLVVLASPNDTHATLAIEAVRSGRHVVVDKPFTITLTEAREVLRAAEQAGRIATVFQNRRWDSDFLAVQNAITAGTLGPVRHFESHIDRYRPTVTNRWRESTGPGAGLWFDLGPHLVDQALFLFGLPNSVHASFARLRPGAQAVDWVHVVLEYPQLRAVLQANMLVAAGSARFAVHGERGSMIKPRADIQEDQLLAGLRPGDPEWGSDPDEALFFDGSGAPPIRRPTPRGSQQEFYARMRDAITDAGPPPVRPHEALGVMAVLEAGQESAETGSGRPLPLTSQEKTLWVSRH